jgi:hypothetical protein
MNWSQVFAAPSLSVCKQTHRREQLPRPDAAGQAAAGAGGLGNRRDAQASVDAFGSQFDSQLTGHLSARVRDLNSYRSAPFFDTSVSGTRRTSDCLRAVGRWIDNSFEYSFSTGLFAPRPRFERGTYCLGGTFAVSPHGVGCRLTCRSAAEAVAGCGLMRLRICGRWLPVGLP